MRQYASHFEWNKLTTWRRHLTSSCSIPGSAVLPFCAKSLHARPDAAYTYVADDVFFPYGQHNAEALVARVVPLIGELISAHKPDLVVIACNTASTLVMTQLREAYGVPFVGTVPAIKPACASSKTKRVSVLGTRGTVETRIHQEADRRFRARLRGDADRALKISRRWRKQRCAAKASAMMISRARLCHALSMATHAQTLSYLPARITRYCSNR